MTDEELFTIYFQAALSTLIPVQEAAETAAQAVRLHRIYYPEAANDDREV